MRFISAKRARAYGMFGGGGLTPLPGGLSLNLNKNVVVSQNPIVQNLPAGHQLQLTSTFTPETAQPQQPATTLPPLNTATKIVGSSFLNPPGGAQTNTPVFPTGPVVSGTSPVVNANIPAPSLPPVVNVQQPNIQPIMTPSTPAPTPGPVDVGPAPMPPTPAPAPGPQQNLPPPTGAPPPPPPRYIYVPQAAPADDSGGGSSNVAPITPAAQTDSGGMPSNNLGLIALAAGAALLFLKFK